MTPEEAIDALCSGDNHRTWRGAWEVVRASNEILDGEYLPHIAKIRGAAENSTGPLGMTLRNNRDMPRLAVKLLEGRLQGLCRCHIYPTTQRLLPESEAKYDHVEILSKEVLDWQMRFVCACMACQQSFGVIEEHSYHYPWAAWSRL